MPGFIHDKLDIKLLLIYVAAHLAAPVDLDTMADLCLCDSGINYFSFSQNFQEMVSQGLMDKTEDDKYIASAKGKEICVNAESSLALTIRTKCDRQLKILNETLLRQKQIRADVRPTDLGADVYLAMDDDTGHVFTLTMIVPSEAEGHRIARRYLDQPSRIFNRILAAVLDEDREDEAEGDPKSGNMKPRKDGKKAAGKK